MNGEGDHFFEGVEKLMEIWFTRTSNNNESGDARSISREKWEEILKSVKCEILDVIHHNDHTAYLLSESSLFVSKNRVILKTCGTTLCLQALPHIVRLAKTECGLDRIADFFYSRKNFMKPDRQPHIHKTFQQEVMFLDNEIKESSAAYCLGRLNGDCWFLYTLNHASNNSLVGVQEPDQTLEILMVDLDPDVMKMFNKYDKKGVAKSPDVFSRESGISDLIPGSQISAEFFEPCGFSMNGLLEKNRYWTIHVTPEPEFSYVSFETNISKKLFSKLIGMIVEIFKPGRFTMTLFVNYQSVVDRTVWDEIGGPSIDGYKCLDKQVAQLHDYCLYYTNYKTKPG
ncbi:S-adenosylmethionine decarboxylase proenzyme-like [Styela clava]|uniref:S-adenosylmethionine decarboxylase proenzyme-like n=1 Tax=Styela clava TaxID=7725 RepID=UPI00193993E0|nr:S-adenosylmethionine decarboxylase proenzyme-like [Styela clava]